MRRLLPLLGLLVALAACRSEPAFRETRRAEAPHRPGAPLRVTTGNGSIEVTQAPASPVGANAVVTVAAELRAASAERLAAARIVTEREEGGALGVSCAWPEPGREPTEGCAFSISIPDAASVVLRTSNGSLRLQGLEGPADLETANGEVVVAGHAGALLARTSNGSIEVSDATASLEARTENGEIVARLADANPGPVLLGTSNGGVRLETGPAFSGEVEASTSNGRLSASGFDSEVPPGATSALVKAGPEGARSRVATTNGEVVLVRRRP